MAAVSSTGWLLVENDGKPFYWNSDSGETSWTDPDAVPDTAALPFGWLYVQGEGKSSAVKPAIFEGQTAKAVGSR